MIARLMRTKNGMDRRGFLRSSGLLACGLTGATSLLAAAAPTANVDQGPNVFGPREGYSPQIGTLVSMLNWMRGAILGPVKGLSAAQLDHLHDAKANSIGALLLHLAAIERLYQVHTFEGRNWGDFDDETKKEWNLPANLGTDARKRIKGHDLTYYLDKLRTVRAHTLAELQQRDDAWLMQIDPNFGWGPTNNYCKWFHVCEHESHHNGQIKWLKSRLPA